MNIFKPKQTISQTCISVSYKITISEKEIEQTQNMSNADQTYYYTEKGKIHLGFKLTELTKEEQINTGGAFFYQKNKLFARVQ